jgi:glycosyltransferase involved in cell wall biosynthesis
MLRALNTHYGSIENARVISNGRNPQHFKPGTKQEFVLSAGRLWDQAKNINRVAEITPELPWPVFVAGDFHHPQQPEQDNSIASRCKWLGALPESELRSWFATAPVYALPALYEPFGYTPLEAALSGCALVLGDIESLREIWRDAAVLINPNDSRELKTALLELIKDEQHRRDMAQRARQRALEFTSARMAQNYFAVYSELLVDSKKQERFAQCA